MGDCPKLLQELDGAFPDITPYVVLDVSVCVLKTLRVVYIFLLIFMDRAMTLSEHTNMYNVIQHASSQANCVIVSPKHVIQNKRPLAPAPDRNSVVYANDNDGRFKRKVQMMAYNSATPQPPASVARRNARERNRVKQVNNGFAALRQHIPANVMAAFGAMENTPSTGRGGSKKLSKVETLRVAVEYIKSLQNMLEDHESDIASNNIINSIVENRYFPGSPESQQFSPYQMSIPTPPSSVLSASPTPSQTSDMSSPTYQPTLYIENYKSYETKGPDDEELLDAIFSWQQTE